MNIRDKAQARVNRFVKLQAHKETIMYDWDEGDEHWQWVCEAPITEIVNWAIAIEAITTKSPGSNGADWDTR